MGPNLVFDQRLVGALVVMGLRLPGSLPDAPRGLPQRSGSPLSAAADRLRTGGRAASPRGAATVGPGASPRGWTRSETPVLRADDRLLDSSQRAWERSQNMIRSQQVRDRTS